MLEKALLRLWPFEEPPERWVAVVGVSVLSLMAPSAGFTLAMYARPGCFTTCRTRAI
jgi:hypothetical protein